MHALGAIINEKDDYIFIAKQNKLSNLSKFLNAEKWDYLFPNRYRRKETIKNANNSELEHQKQLTDFYSFDAFLNAAKMFPTFLNEGNDSTQRRELAAFLANMAHETSGGWEEAPGGIYKWGLYFTTEKGFPNASFNYSDTSKKKWPPVTDVSYHGRGALQLSWNYNYGQFSEAYFGDKQVLLDNPDLLLQDPVLCFASAIWFWMRDQYPKPSCHSIMVGNWQPTIKDVEAGRGLGFGTVVNVINGGLECGENHSDRTKYRYGFYNYFCDFLKIDPGPNAECSTQKPFGK